jgi:hypothetical protein
MDNISRIISNRDVRLWYFLEEWCLDGRLVGCPGPCRRRRSFSIDKVTHHHQHSTATPKNTFHLPPSTSMAPPRRQSTVKAVPQASAPSTSQTPTPRPTFAPPTTSPSTLKIHPLLEIYEATISALIGALSDDPFRVDAIHNYTNRLLQCEKDLEDALEEGKPPCALWVVFGGFVVCGDSLVWDSETT